MADEHPEENFPQLIARLRAEYGVSEPQIAEAIGVSVSAVNTWTSGKRAMKKGPRTATLEALHEAYPKFSRERIFAAAKRQAPGPLDADEEGRLLEVFRDLTDEQRRSFFVQMRAVADTNRTGQ